MFLGNNIGLKSLNLKLDEEMTIKDVIKKSVENFNENLKKHNEMYSIKTDYTTYSLKQSRKNGKAKTDIPSKFLHA